MSWGCMASESWIIMTKKMTLKYEALHCSANLFGNPQNNSPVTHVWVPDQSPGMTDLENCEALADYKIFLLCSRAVLGFLSCAT